MTLTLIIIGLLALVLTFLVVLPLAFPGQADPLPDDRDPHLLELEEERDALLNAIRELDAREDLAQARRDELHARYETKAAKVLRAIDERNAELSGQAPAPRPTGPRRASWSWVGLVVIAAGMAATLGGWVVPRVGEDTTITTNREADIAAGQAIQEAQRAAERDPSGLTYAALGDVYWMLQDAQGAIEAYTTATTEHDDAPADAYLRLGLLTLQRDPALGRSLLEEARAREPDNPNVLGSLGEVYLQEGLYPDALAAFEALALLPEAQGDPMVQERIDFLQDVAPLQAAVDADPNVPDLLALADALWDFDARTAAVQRYFRILTDFDAQEPIALARVGELLFLEGAIDDAVEILTRARDNAQARDVQLPVDTLLFLGNAAFARQEYTLAIDAWEEHLERAETPGRVPQLLARAEALAAGEPDPGMGVVSQEVQALSDGPALYAAHCASCHGATGGGGTGPRLAGNGDVARRANVESLVRYGRGLMPGFQAILTDEQVQVLTDWTVDTFAP